MRLRVARKQISPKAMLVERYMFQRIQFDIQACSQSDPAHAATGRCSVCSDLPSLADAEPDCRAALVDPETEYACPVRDPAEGELTPSSRLAT